MRKHLLFALAAFVLISRTAFAQKAGAESIPLQLADLYSFDQPTSPVVSPDGQNVAYIRQWVERGIRAERHALYLATAGQPPVALESREPDARAPLFSPDGKWIVVRSTRARPKGWEQTPPVPPESDPATDIWLVRLSDKKTFPLAGDDKPYGRVFLDPFYGRVAFSADGKKLVFVADDGGESRTPAEAAANVFVARQDQGEGYTGFRAAQIWIAELDGDPQTFAATKIERLTDDNVWYGDPNWSPDGKSIVVHANKTNDRESVRFSINKNYDLWSIDVASKKMTQLTTGPGPDVSPRFSPDGQRIICLSSPRKGPHADVFNFTVIDLATGSPISKTLFDHHAAGAATKPPHAIPSFPLPDASWQDNGSLVYNVAAGLKTETHRLNVHSGEGRPLGEQDAESRFVKEQEVRRQLTPEGNTFLARRLKPEFRVYRWENEGFALDGALTIPHEKVARPPYKLLVFPHGGPHSRASVGANFTADIFAAHGYLVFQPNFRGSAGYGLKFLDADRGDFGGGDMRDILTGVDKLIADKLADPQRQYVYGVSYGGFMTTWLVGHTQQFRAAVAQNAVTDLNVMWGLSDIQSWTEWEFGGRPWEIPELMRKHSPISYVDKVITPTLILHAREDRRVPIAMGEMFYRSLEKRGVKTGFVIYPNEGHGIKQLRHREDVLRRTLAWFDAN